MQAAMAVAMVALFPYCHGVSCGSSHFHDKLYCRFRGTAKSTRFGT